MPRRLPFSARAAYAHLREADPVVGALIEEHGPYRPRPGGDPYASMVRSILFQQLAGAAARAIQRRFFALHGDEERTPEPLAILATSDEAFRGAGVSRQKAGYLRDLAQHCVDGALDFAAIADLDDAAVIERLTAVRGIGEWSAHMFLMFELGRPDVLPTGDLGVRKGMQAAYGLPETPTPKQCARDRRALVALPHRRLLVHVARRRDDYTGRVGDPADLAGAWGCAPTADARSPAERPLPRPLPRGEGAGALGSRAPERGSRGRAPVSRSGGGVGAQPPQEEKSGVGGRAERRAAHALRDGVWGRSPRKRLAPVLGSSLPLGSPACPSPGRSRLSPATYRTRGASPRGPALPLPRPCAGTGPRPRPPRSPSSS